MTDNTDDTPAPLQPPSLTKSEVNYRYAGDSDPDRCQNCRHYHQGVRNMNACDKVFGLVHGLYTCNLFEE